MAVYQVSVPQNGFPLVVAQGESEGCRGAGDEGPQVLRYLGDEGPGQQRCADTHYVRL